MGESGGCGPSCLRRSGPHAGSGRGGWCTLRYWNRRVRNCIKTCVSSGEAYNDNNNVAEQPSAQAGLHTDDKNDDAQASLRADINNDAKDQALPEITVADLDILLARLEAEVQRLSPSTSSFASLVHGTISHWEERKQSITTFMKSLPNQVVKEVVDPGRDLVIKLLIGAFGGAGQVHWLGLGLSLMAWSLENINRATQNYEDGLEVLRQSVRLLKSTKQIWEHVRRAKDESTSYEHDLQDTVEKAFRCAIICTSNLNDNRIVRFLKASNVQEGMNALKEELNRATIRNIEVMGRFNLCDTSKLEHQVVYSNIDDKKRVGGVGVANEAMTFLKQDSDGIIALCLHGMGGIGKSFMGMEIFTRIQEGNRLQEGIHYKECRVELEFGIQLDKLKDIQKQILEKVWGQNTSFSNTIDGRQTLEDNLKKMKEPIFLYLDNVLESEDLVEILPEVSCFPPKSRILVTSRGTLIQAVIEELGISECKHIEVRSLQENLARELLWKQIRSIEKYKDAVIDDSCKKLEEEVLELCGGLPLALKVVGGYIASDRKGPKDAGLWQDVVDSMQNAESLGGKEKDKLFFSLRFSINNLNEAAKKAFLDMVSFYDVGDSWRILKCVVGDKFMKVLKERALVQKLQNTSHTKQQISTGKIHDLLMAIGKKMIKEDPNELRITGKEEFDNINNNDVLLKKVVAVKDVTLEACLLKRMPLLRFLKDVQVIKGECPDAQLRHLAVVHGITSKTGNPFNFRECASLKAVSWGGDPWKLNYIRPIVNAFNLEVLRDEKISKVLQIFRIANWRKLENVDAIETFGCLRELVISFIVIIPNELIKCVPEGIENLTRLRELRLEGLGALECLPKGITSLTCLKRLSLRGCVRLQSVPDGIAELTGLTSLDLESCRRLQALPEGVGNLTGLIELNLQRCSSLQALPEGIGCLTGLTALNLWFCENLKTLPQGVGNLTGLTELNLRYCGNLKNLPQGVGNLTGLTSLQMDGCGQLQYLPEEMTRLNNLKIVSLSDCKSLTSLPKGFVGLQELSMDGCDRIESIAQELACLQCLSKLRFSCARDHSLLPQEISMLACSLTELRLLGCDTLQSIDEIATLVRLTGLSLHSCNALQSIEGITALVCLRDLRLQEFNSLQQLPPGVSKLTNLTSLQVQDCRNLRSIPEEISSLMRLTELELVSCGSLESIPQGIGSLTGLRKLSVQYCSSMQALPQEVTGLLGLRYLQLQGCESLQHLPDGLSKLSGLMELNLKNCKSLQCLPPDGLSRLTSLTQLDLENCTSLQCLPAGISRLTGLQRLNFRGCENLKSLPQEIARMALVQHLDLTQCSALQALPGGVAGMRGLKEMDLQYCTSLESLPQEITSLSGLQRLNLSGCTSLKSLPQGISSLSGLQRLNLRGCTSLKSLPQGISSLIGLKRLYLDGCTSLELEEIFCMSCLEELSLQGLENIQVLPQGLASMTSLEELCLSNCTSLLSLPEELANLKYLEFLYLQNCESLKCLPQGISSLTQLQVLDLRGCKSLFSLPEGVTKLAVNCEIRLDGCPASMPL